MDFIRESFSTAFLLIAGMDPDVLGAVRISLFTALVSTLIASAVGIALAFLIGLEEFRGKRFVTSLLNTLLALPTVVIGLVLYALLSRQGPLGSFELLFTPTAMILGQTVLAIPIITSHALSVLSTADPRLVPSALTLGLSRFRAARVILGELRFGIMAAVIGGFGRVVSEVGAAMMLGGNIRGYTRTMTTAIALETSTGNFARSLALGGILIGVALVANLALNLLQQPRTGPTPARP